MLLRSEPGSPPNCFRSGSGILSFVMDLGLKGRTAIVTGASRGIGFQVARCLAAEGCNVVICGRSEPDLAKAARELAEASARVATIRADVTKAADASKFVKLCTEQFGRLDILVNNVGGSVGARLLVDSADEDWLATFELNVVQTVRMIRLAIPAMRPQGGAIVNIASISGWHSQLAGTGQYGASKAALIFLTERLALELARERIRVNSVSPGSTLFDDGGWDRFRKSNPESFDRYVTDGFPMGRLGTPQEVAQAVVFLCSPRAEWINGRNIPVDGLEQPVPTREDKPW
jgi:3-oxoacyl-[acyl-carrier protein] reductase